MTWGLANCLATLNVGLKAAPWAPATNLAPTTLSAGWQFKPGSLAAAIPQTQWRTQSGSNWTPERVEVAIFDRWWGSQLTDLNPGTSSGAAGQGWNWFQGKLMFTTGNGQPANAFQVFTSAMNDGNPQSTPTYAKMANAVQPTGSNYVFGGEPIIFRRVDGYDSMGQLWGVTGNDELSCTDPFWSTTFETINTAPTGHGNPPFFCTTGQFINVISVNDPLDFVNRLFVGYSTLNGGPWLFFWQHELVADQVLVTPHINDNAYLDGLLQSGQAQVAAWPGGFLVGFSTNGAGPTGQPTEWLVIDIDWQNYYLLNFIAEDSYASAVMGHAAGVNTLAIDNAGTIWANNSNFAFYETPLVDGLVEPVNVPINLTQNPPVNLPCFDPCVFLP